MRRFVYILIVLTWLAMALPAIAFAEDGSARAGFGVLVVGGQDPDGVNMQGF